jgi:DNA-binding transcriptional LysR family regulator
MSVAQLEYFVAVAEEEHLTRAAARLHISQPPLSRQIQRLEAEVGTPLFTRSPRGMRLLPAGRVLLEEARAILERIQALPTRVKAVETDHGTPIREPGARMREHEKSIDAPEG